MKAKLLLLGLSVVLLASDALAGDCWVQLDLRESSQSVEMAGMEAKYGDYRGALQQALPGYRTDRLLKVYNNQGRLENSYILWSQRLMTGESFSDKGSSGKVIEAPTARTKAIIPWQDDLGRVSVQIDGKESDLATVDPQSARCESNCRRDNERLRWGTHCCNGLAALPEDGGEPVCRRCGDRQCSKGEASICPSDCRAKTADAECFPGLRVDYGCGDVAAYYPFDGNVRNSARPLFNAKVKGKPRFQASQLGNQAVQLDGKTSVVVQGWRGSGPGSISLWFRGQQQDLEEPQGLVSVGDRYGTGYTLTVDSQKRLQLKVQLKNRKAAAASTGKKQPRARNVSGKSKAKVSSGWNHVTLVREMQGRQWHVYLNGESVILVRVAAPVSFRKQSSVALGALRVKSKMSNLFTGQLDNVSLWYRGLSNGTQSSVFSSGNKKLARRARASRKGRA